MPFELTAIRSVHSGILQKLELLPNDTYAVAADKISAIPVECRVVQKGVFVPYVKDGEKTWKADLTKYTPNMEAWAYALRENRRDGVIVDYLIPDEDAFYDAQLKAEISDTPPPTKRLPLVKRRR